MGVGERHFRGGVADNSSRSSATFQCVASLRTQCVNRHGEGSEEGSRDLQKVAESKPCQTSMAESPDEARADTVARVPSLEAAISSVGRSRRSGSEVSRGVSRESQEKHQCCPHWSQIKFCDEIHRAHPVEGGNKGRRDCQKEEEVRLLQSQRAEEMASLVAAEARLESFRAEAAPTNVPAPPLVNVEDEFRRMQRVIDELQAELARFRSKKIRATESDKEDMEMLATNLPQSKKSRRTVQACSPVFWPLVERQWTHPR